MQIVLDTSVLYAGVRSAHGASRVILALLADRKLTAVLTPAIFLEYEERLLGDPALHALGLTDQALIDLLDELASLSARVRIDIRWRPVSTDPDDDMVIECAVNGQADMIITFNTRDLRMATEQFGIPVVTPAEFLAGFGGPT
jgi:putative PIN family toxin of toxin-antitoxin system